MARLRQGFVLKKQILKGTDEETRKSLHRLNSEGRHAISTRAGKEKRRCGSAVILVLKGRRPKKHAGQESIRGPYRAEEEKHPHGKA